MFWNLRKALTEQGYTQKRAAAEIGMAEKCPRRGRKKKPGRARRGGENMEITIRITLQETTALLHALAESQELAKVQKEIAEIIENETAAHNGDEQLYGAMSSRTRPAGR